MAILVQFATTATTGALGSFMLYAFRQTQATHLSPRRGQVPAFYMHMPDTYTETDAGLLIDDLKLQFGASIVMAKVSTPR